MDTTRKLDLRPLLAVAAIALVAAAIWAAAALASGGSSPSSSDPGTSRSPGAAFVQDDGGDRFGRDCPERDGDAPSGDSDQPSTNL